MRKPACSRHVRMKTHPTILPRSGIELTTPAHGSFKHGQGVHSAAEAVQSHVSLSLSKFFIVDKDSWINYSDSTSSRL